MLSSCSTVDYYSQAIGGQLEILRKQKPIDEVLADPATEKELRQQLQLVGEIRAFALERLALPGAESHYTKYADLERPYVLWNVFAAPEFSLAPKTWWYPVVGNLAYRGFFEKEDARAFVTQLKDDGFDVTAGGVTAYSTLGFFRDPVLNTFIDDTEIELAGLLFHELAHHRFFLKGDTRFSESLASAVQQEGLRLWVEKRGSPELARKLEVHLRAKHDFVGLVLETREELKTLYQESPQETPEQIDHLRAEKARIIKGLKSRYEAIKKADWGGEGHYDKWIARDLNNAHLNTVATYYDYVPGFKKVLKDCEYDFEAFFERVAEIAKLPKEERKKILASSG